jgi:hypothetical protein
MVSPLARTALAAVAAALIGPPALAQTIEERAAQVQRALATPPPTEMTIDRGTRVLGQPGVAPAAAPVPTVDPRLTSGGAASTSSSTTLQPATGAAGAAGPGAPRPTGFVNDPRGTGFLNDTRGAGGVAARSGMPGLVVVQPAGADQVTGTANLVTGSDRSPGLAP